MGNTENIVRPRLNDYHGILLLQDKVDFAIPFLDEDIPLYVDPFLLWKSPSQMDNGLHDSIFQSFNHLGYLVNKGNYRDAADLLILPVNPNTKQPILFVPKRAIRNTMRRCIISDRLFEYLK